MCIVGGEEQLPSMDRGVWGFEDEGERRILCVCFVLFWEYNGREKRD